MAGSGNDVTVAVVGAGAAGVGAAWRLAQAGCDFQVLEARDRIGGRAWTVTGLGPDALDLGCHWLHSADRNPWVGVADELGFMVDRTPAPWGRTTGNPAFPPGGQAEFRADREAFWDRVHAAAEAGEDRPASDLADPASPWNPLIAAGSTWANGVEPDRLSTLDHWRYDDTDFNWRLPAGYGALVAARARGLPIRLGCPVTRIDHSGRRIRLETPQGTLTADRVIVTLPPPLLLTGGVVFHPALPDKLAAAAGLPLGLADKLYIALDRPDMVPVEGQIYGRIDSTAIGAYHLRPLGRDYIEGYFGGIIARRLEAGGIDAFFAHAVDDLVRAFGSAIRPHLRPLTASAWARDPLALGSYSHALPGFADARAALAAPVEGRILFAGEACSANDFSTAHGAYQTGVAAAEQVLAAAP
ncbi:monoamine oxidase [Stella humosa]|uniref:Tryptophan 2-monooxygenase n=1 Tax=Stella humosa TaxID=94 RepID=A0A3N1M9F4_9PROT|nr:NAD(P)/FAD-dependent oxidoreductase [Stella humosa]ROQ00301.1 monoamine oxidase [Stella humosa]BBK30461.1 amine oxidase [Stella humosa]